MNRRSQLAAAGAAALPGTTAAAQPGTGSAFSSLPFACVSGPLAGQTISVDLTPSEPAPTGCLNGTPKGGTSW
jgi:hypothetical protein